MFMLQLQVATFDDLERIVACLKHSADPAVVAQVQAQADTAVAGGITAALAAEKPKGKPGRPKREVAPPLPESAAPTTETAEPKGESTVQDATESAQQTYTITDARAALAELVARTPKDYKNSIAVLAKFDAVRISQVKEADYADFITACQAA